jgi:hypothetical protein
VLTAEARRSEGREKCRTLPLRQTPPPRHATLHRRFTPPSTAVSRPLLLSSFLPQSSYLTHGILPQLES